MKTKKQLPTHFTSLKKEQPDHPSILIESQTPAVSSTIWLKLTEGDEQHTSPSSGGTSYVERTGSRSVCWSVRQLYLGGEKLPKVAQQ